MTASRPRSPPACHTSSRASRARRPKSSLDYEDVEDFFHPEGQRHLLVSIPLQYVFDNRDNKLDPKKGFRALAFAEPTYDILTGATFVKFRGDVSAYQALDDGRQVRACRPRRRRLDPRRVRRGYSGRPALLCRRRRLGARLCLSGHRPEGPRRQPDRRAFLCRDCRSRCASPITETIGIVPFVDAGTVSEDEFLDFCALPGRRRRRLALSDAVRAAPDRRGGAAQPRTRRSRLRHLCRRRPGVLRPMRYLKRFLRLLRYSIYVVLAFAVGAVAVLTLTERGRDNLAGLISDFASSPGQTVRMSGIDGIWSGRLTLDNLVLEDAGGPLARRARTLRSTGRRWRCFRRPSAPTASSPSASNWRGCPRPSSDRQGRGAALAAGLAVAEADRPARHRARAGAGRRGGVHLGQGLGASPRRRRCEVETELNWRAATAAPAMSTRRSISRPARTSSISICGRRSRRAA